MVKQTGTSISSHRHVVRAQTLLSPLLAASNVPRHRNGSNTVCLRFVLMMEKKIIISTGRKEKECKLLSMTMSSELCEKVLIS